MSLTHPDQVTCTCGATVNVYVADSLNPSRHPQLRDLLMERRLHLFTCAVCQLPFVIEKELAYLDYERRQFLAVFPRADRPVADARARSVMATYERYLCTNAPAFVVEQAHDFLVRICFGYEELREKLVIDDAGLADLSIEALKMDLLTAESWFRDSGVLTLRLDHLDPDGTLHFLPEWLDGMAPVGGSAERPVVVKRELYDAVNSRHDDLLRLRPGLASGPHVSLLRLLEWEAPPLQPTSQRRPLI